jgi:uncharacterized protein (TIGR03790 family)
MLGLFSSHRRHVSGAIFAVYLLSASPASAQSAENVAVVINENSPESQQIGEHYARTRSLPAGNVFRIRVSTEEIIERGVYLSAIEAPIAAAIRQGGLHDRILYLVLTKGVPLRIAGTPGLSGTLASVDSELTLLYRRMTGQAVSPTGRIDNPYFLGSRELGEALPFSHREHDIYLVTRIDAFTVDEAMSLMSRAQMPSQNGPIVLDQHGADLTPPGNRWISETARRLTEQGHAARIVLEGTVKPAQAESAALGFYAWGVIDPEQRRRTTGIKFAPGAIASTLAGANARTFKQPGDSWMPAASSDPATFFAGSAETLVGDLIRDGVTGVAGQIDEPFVLGAVRPEILFPAYLAGFNLAEAFYLATPALSWTTIIVGDPLCRPFAGRSLTSAELEVAPDARTELPGFFSARRLSQAVAATPAVPEAAVALTVHAETLLARGNTTAAREALEQALEAAPSAADLLMRLAALEETAGLHTAAIARYQRIVEIQPSNVIALNNLAYALAVRSNAPAEALALARRAVTLAPRNAYVIDTLAWIEHLLGNHAVAAKLLAGAITLDPEVSDIRLHAATVAAALGDRANAESELKEAIRLDPSIEQRAETKQLRERIAALPVQKP